MTIRLSQLTGGQEIKAASGNIIISTQLLTGITSGNAVGAGYIGEVITGTVASGSAVSIATNTVTDITSVALSEGDWLITGLLVLTGGGLALGTADGSAFYGTAAGNNTTGKNTATNNLTLPGTIGSQYFTSTQTFVMPSYLVNISSPTTYYLKTSYVFSGSTVSGYGTIQGRRVA